MRYRSPALYLLTVLVLGCSSHVQAGTVNCSTIQADAADALRAHDLISLRQHLGAAVECGGATVNDVQSLLVRELWTRAKTLQRDDPESPKLKRLLLEVVLYNHSWKALSWLADVHARDGEYIQATQSYQRAIDVLNDQHKTPTAPNKAEIRQLIGKARNAQFLAKDYVPTTMTRNGRPSGLASDNVRGVIISKRDVPVTFKFDSSAFTAKGRAAAYDLAREIKLRNPNMLTLIGHTDDVGTVQYNWALSVRRAQALGRFLLSQGVQATIIATGRGKSEAVFNFNQSLDLAQYRQRCRRVEVMFN